MGQHRVDLAGIGDEIVGGRRGVLAAHLAEQALEIAHIAVDRRAELLLLLIAATDLVEGLLALERVKAAREDVLLAAIVTLPEFARRLRIDGAGDLAGEIAERFLRTVGAGGRAGLLGRLLLFARGTAQQIADPAARLGTFGSRLRCRGRRGSRGTRSRRGSGRPLSVMATATMISLARGASFRLTSMPSKCERT